MRVYVGAFHPESIQHEVELSNTTPLLALAVFHAWCGLRFRGSLFKAVRARESKLGFHCGQLQLTNSAASAASKNWLGHSVHAYLLSSVMQYIHSVAESAFSTLLAGYLHHKGPIPLCTLHHKENTVVYK